MLGVLTKKQTMFEPSLFPKQGRTVEQIPYKMGKDFVTQHHYLHGISGGAICFGLFENDDLVGVCAFANPVSEAVCASIFGDEHKRRILELHRLVILDEIGDNAESFFIARSLKLLKVVKPYLWGVVSFADSTEGHIGVIYQATNAIYYGKTNKNKGLVDNTGRLRHTRLNGKNITKKQADEWGWEWVMRDPKHRYLFLLPDNRSHKKLLLKSLLIKQLPYPKHNKENE